MKNYYQYIIGAVIGGIIVFLLIGRVPDIKYEHDTMTHTEFSHSVSTVVITNNAVVSGGTNATINPNGSISISGNNLSVTSNSTTTSNSVTDTASTTSSTHSEKTTTYNGSVFVLYNPFELKVYPSIIGLTYTIFNPICLMVQYDIDDRKVFVGGELKF